MRSLLVIFIVGVLLTINSVMAAPVFATISKGTVTTPPAETNAGILVWPDSGAANFDSPSFAKTVNSQAPGANPGALLLPRSLL